MNDTVIANLKIARSLINKGWAQHSYCRDQDGKTVSIVDPAATCYCLVAALPTDHGEAIHALRKTLQFTEEASLVDWNDDSIRTQAEVVELIDQTIERLQQEDIENETTNA
jgi:hypothetical protein